MTDREKLKNMIRDGHGYFYSEEYKGLEVYDAMAEYLLAHGVTMQEWISVKDRLPDKNRKAVLIALRWEETDIGWYSKDDKCWQSEFINSYEDGDVTHWQPLPQPPKGE